MKRNSYLDGDNIYKDHTIKEHKNEKNLWDFA